DQPVGTGFVAIDHSTPVAEGSVSVSRTFVALGGPAFVTVTVKPICEPPLTEAESAVLLIEPAGVRTTVMGASNPSQLHFDALPGRVPKRKPVGVAPSLVSGQSLSAP